MSNQRILAQLEQHPRLIGYLFTAGMVLAQAGSVAGNGASSTPGP
ncbi:DUF7503 family protein [Halorussus salinus]